MNTRGRLLTLLIAALLAVFAIGCGVKTEDAGGSSGGTVVDEPNSDGGGFSEGSSADETVTTTDSPETTEDTPAEPAGTTEPDTTETTEDTPAEPATTTEPDDTTPSSLPPGVDEEQVKDQLATGFKSLGLNDEESTCLADAYIREFGLTTGTPDTSKIIDLFAECGIDPTKIGGG